ncbi:MAG: aminopeptidase P family protein [Rhodospirillales bacterium]|nr:aminopeptidase P family protein [Rhodospirillales bacterium]
MVDLFKFEKQLSFKKEEYLGRLAKIRKTMAEKGVDALLVTTPENICYISGYRTVGYYYMSVLVVPIEKDLLLITRNFEARNVDAFSWMDRASQCRPYMDTDNPVDVVAKAVKDVGHEKGRLAVDKTGNSFLAVDVYEGLVSKLPNAKFANSFGIVEQHRKIKSTAEIEYIKKSCRMSEAGLKASHAFLKPGVTENQLAGVVHKAMIDMGCEFPGLPPFIGSGWRTQVPHVQWTDKVIEKGENVPVELTGVTHRYAGPLFRTFMMGKPAQKMYDDFQVVKDQLEAAIAAMKPGATSGDVDAAAKKAAAKHNRLGSFTKRTGYSVGLNYAPDWGEGHIIDLKANDPSVLQAGMTFHTPMSLRADKELAVAVSETTLVTEKGPQVLTSYPRELLVID